MTREDLLVTIVNAALDGGKEILAIYNAAFSVETKADNSPITQADKNAHNTIVKALEKTNLPAEKSGKNVLHMCTLCLL